MEKLKRVIKQSVVLEDNGDDINIVPDEETSYSFKILLTNKPYNLGLMDSYSKYYLNIFLIIENDGLNSDDYGFTGELKIYDYDTDEKLKSVGVMVHGGLNENIKMDHLGIDDDVLNKNIITPDLKPKPEKKYKVDFENLEPIQRVSGVWGLVNINSCKWGFNYDDLSGENKVTDDFDFEENNVINIFISYELLMIGK